MPVYGIGVTYSKIMKMPNVVYSYIGGFMKMNLLYELSMCDVKLVHTDDKSTSISMGYCRRIIPSQNVNNFEKYKDSSNGRKGKWFRSLCTYCRGRR